MNKNRYLSKVIDSNLKTKMVFIGGARQVGKTTLAKEIIAPLFGNSEYYNWDFAPDRNRLKKLEFPGEPSLLILDEIHKLRGWKRFLKGIYDTQKDRYRFLVTGSARLNIFRRGGDSLQGRYHYYTLHPFSFSELMNHTPVIEPGQELQFTGNNSADTLNSLLQFGGFPEPFLSQSRRTLRRWHAEKLERLFREDIRETEDIRDFSNLKLLGDMLPQKAGAPLSVNAIREDLEVSHKAVTNWLNILEQFYYHFRIYPFAGSKVRSIKKAPKLYLVDWSEIEDEGARFENLIASHLLKTIDFLRESEGYKTELFYLRGTDGKEVNFLITHDGKPWFAVEAKLTETAPSPQLRYFKERLQTPYTYQVIRKSGVDILRDGIRIISSDKFLGGVG
ncbi:MAG: ATP-binding protein [Ignavibacteriales bacterium]|nr:MAG: ATP-binding protein [Ignavibacteriales bacterium]